MAGGPHSRPVVKWLPERTDLVRILLEKLKPVFEIRTSAFGTVISLPSNASGVLFSR